ncbi:MAG: agmatine deiminase family protein [Gammaproteobacteria bacterium]|nr:agmatine deiminase family protein [Gammaproteobacteria bacterium]
MLDPQHYRMPAEWAPHAATWLSWPHNRDTWPGCFDGVEPAMVEAAAALAESELVRINVLDEAHEAHVRRLLDPRVPPERVEFHLIPTNDAWVRDHGAIFVTRRPGAPAGAPALLALDFEYNAWGGKYPPFDLDRLAAARMAQALGVPVARRDIVLEGGSVDVNGAGALLTTEQCLLNPNRNPSLDRRGIEAHLASAFGVDEIVWLGDGIEGDDTDGHVDDLTRFVDERTVVTVVEPNAKDPNHAPLAANRERLASVRIGGVPLRVVELPMPEPLRNGGERLPASYANFYVANEVVLLPVFRCAKDGEAEDVLGAAFPGRRIVPIDCRALVGGLGALHCLTQQVPAAP